MLLVNALRAIALRALIGMYGACFLIIIVLLSSTLETDAIGSTVPNFSVIGKIVLETWKQNSLENTRK